MLAIEIKNKELTYNIAKWYCGS